MGSNLHILKFKKYKKVGDFLNFKFKNYKKLWGPIKDIGSDVYILKLEKKMC